MSASDWCVIIAALSVAIVNVITAWRNNVAITESRDLNTDQNTRIQATVNGESDVLKREVTRLQRLLADTVPAVSHTGSSDKPTSPQPPADDRSHA